VKDAIVEATAINVFQRENVLLAMSEPLNGFKFEIEGTLDHSNDKINRRKEE